MCTKCQMMIICDGCLTCYSCHCFCCEIKDEIIVNIELNEAKSDSGPESPVIETNVSLDINDHAMN